MLFSHDHEWVNPETGAVGITAFAADALGDIVYVQLPEVGATIAAGESCGEVESTKSVSELYAPVAGTVLEVNDAVVEDPSLINVDPFGKGWLYRIEITGEVALMTAEEYERMVSA